MIKFECKQLLQVKDMDHGYGNLYQQFALNTLCDSWNCESVKGLVQFDELEHDNLQARSCTFFFDKAKGPRYVQLPNSLSMECSLAGSQKLISRSIKLLSNEPILVYLGRHRIACAAHDGKFSSVLAYGTLSDFLFRAGLAIVGNGSKMSQMMHIYEWIMPCCILICRPCMCMSQRLKSILMYHCTAITFSVVQ